MAELRSCGHDVGHPSGDAVVLSFRGPCAVHWNSMEAKVVAAHLDEFWGKVRFW